MSLSLANKLDAEMTQHSSSLAERSAGKTPIRYATIYERAGEQYRFIVALSAFSSPSLAPSTIFSSDGAREDG